MFVPTVIVPTTHTNTTIINKTIVYSDTVLNLKELGSNLKVTSLSNVSEFELENCLETIFENNEDVVFNTVQYSKENKKIYFYTDKEISTKKWEESKVFKYKTITNKKEILEELKSILNYNKIKDPNVVSLSLVYDVVKEKDVAYENDKKLYENIIDSKLKEKYSDEAFCVIHNFDYENNIMNIGFKEYNWDEIYSIYFSKKNGDLYVVKSKGFLYTNEHLVNLGKELSELYDKFLTYKSFDKESRRIKGINSNFKIRIYNGGVGLYNEIIPNDFSLYNYIFKNDYSYDCNSYEIVDLIKGSEDKLFDKIYVNIDDCPNWMQEELKQARYEELVNEEKIEKEIKEKIRLEELERELKEIKKQKRLALKRKIFPWIK